MKSQIYNSSERFYDIIKFRDMTEFYEKFFLNANFRGENLVIEFVLGSKERLLIVDFFGLTFPCERPYRKHHFLQIKTTRDVFDKLMQSNATTWNMLQKKYNDDSPEVQRFWKHFTSGEFIPKTAHQNVIKPSPKHTLNSGGTLATTKSTTKKENGSTSNGKECLTMVRQIMVPTMTISSILAGIWIRYILKHGNLNDLF